MLWTVIGDAGRQVWRVASDEAPEVGGLFTAEDGSAHQIVVVDGYSKFVETNPVEDVQAAE